MLEIVVKFFFQNMKSVNIHIRLMTLKECGINFGKRLKIIT